MTARRQSEASASPVVTTATSAVPAWPGNWPAWLTALALAAVCVAAYANAFTAGFALDNRQLILNDPRVHALTAENLSNIARHTYWWPYGESGLYRPLTTFSYLFDFAILGHVDRPTGYHAVNLLLHIGNVLMVWRLTRHVGATHWVSMMTAAIWAVIPLSTEAVTNVVGRADLMAAAGMLGGLLLYLRARGGVGADAAMGGEPRSGVAQAACYAGAALAVTAGVLAKESAVAVIGLFALIEACWWTPGRSIRSVGLMLTTVALPLAAWAWIRHGVLAAGGAAEFPFTDNPIVGASFSSGRLTALYVMVRYVALLAWPVRLSNDYSYPQIPLADGSATGWLGMLLLLGGVMAALWQVRANRLVVFWAGFAFITFLPASNLLLTTGTIMGERLMYVPSIAGAGLVAMGLEWVAAQTRLRHLATAAAFVLIAAYGARTVTRNRDWRDDLTLWRSAVRNTPDSAKAHRAFAEALYASDPSHANIDDVLAEAQTSVDLLNDVPDQQNDFQSFRQAGAYYLDKAEAYHDAAEPASDAIRRAIYARAQRLLDRAVVIARLGASQLPGGSVEPEADVQRLRAVALLGLGNPDTALIAANRSRALAPRHPLPYHLGASALIARHRDMEAAMLLLTGGIVSGDPSLGQEAMRLYTSGLDSDGCAVTGSGANAALNAGCPIVQHHSCVASAAAYQILNAHGEPVRAQQVKESAITALGCPAELMDRANSLVQ